MNRINAKLMGLACGLTGMLLYIACMIAMAIIGHNGSVKIANSLLHGLDVSSIIRMEVPILESVMGILESFILFGIIGVCISGFYNFLVGKLGR